MNKNEPLTAKVFNKKYGRKGGILALTTGRALMITQDHLAKEYGVSKERIRQWMEKFFGSKYDPREPRRTAILDCMMEFARNNSQEDFIEAYRGSEYFQLAINRAIEEGIYSSKEL